MRSDENEDCSSLPRIIRCGAGLEKAIRVHEALCPARNRSSLEAPPAEAGEPALPFSDAAIPREIVIEIAMRLSTSEDLSVYALAEEYGYPIELLERELADCRGQYERELRRRAGGHRRPRTYSRPAR